MGGMLVSVTEIVKEKSLDAGAEVCGVLPQRVKGRCFVVTAQVSSWCGLFVRILRYEATDEHR
jgi:hypothetical protein